MKKVFLALAVVTVALVACNNEEKKVEPTSKDTTPVVSSKDSTPVAAPAVDAPKADAPKADAPAVKEK